jgi:hypothetical protein
MLGVATPSANPKLLAGYPVRVETRLTVFKEEVEVA